MKKAALWDLDGTLTDPRIGITRCIQHALRAHGHAVPEEAELLRCIGPPLQQSFQLLQPQLTDKQAWALVEKYRERFSTVGLIENEIYLGIPDALAECGHLKHYVATSKPHVYASRIVEHFGLAAHFTHVHGSELDGTRGDKGELIAHILRTENLSPHDTVMIGDRKHDIIGAKKNGLRTLGVTWGYGGREELEAASADQIFETPATLQAFLLTL